MRILKRLSFSLLVVLLVVLVIATIAEKIYGTSYAFQYIYNSPVFVSLWIALALSALAYLIKRKIFRKPVTMLLHLSFIVILAGALFTHIYSTEGTIHLRKGDSKGMFIDIDGMGHNMPFSISLDRFQINYHTGSHLPSDYHSRVVITDEKESIDGDISMNNILKYRGYRFYQAGFDEDEEGVTLMVKHDPVGIAITYIGYSLLFISMLLFFFSSKTKFRTLIKNMQMNRALLILLFFMLNPFSSFSKESAKFLPEETTAKFDNINVMYNGRIAPLQTLMQDFMLKIYGSTYNQGHTSEEVFTGIMFFPDSWKGENIIKVGDKRIRSILNIDGSYASINDLFDKDGNNKLDALDYNKISNDAKLVRAIDEISEKYSLAFMAMEGELFRVVPVREDKEIEWVSPKQISLGKDSLKIGEWLDAAKKSISEKRFSRVDSLISELRHYQSSVSGVSLPSEAKIKSELLYNRLRNHTPISITLIVIGAISFIYFGVLLLDMSKVKRVVVYLLNAILVCTFLYTTLLIALRWFIGGHIPVSNGFETMLFMSWSVTVLTLSLQRKFGIVLPFGLILSGFTLLVSTLGETNPQITYLVPVLSSPLLSIHVVVIMISYSLLAFMMLNGVMAFLIKCFSKECEMQIERLQIFSNILLYPALFLLATGIFIGAIWANISWGSYWGWDPKEVWALITMLIYSLALHQESLPLFRNKMFFHLFTIIAFLSVLFTYFGVNFILGGMHSYA